MTTVQHKFVELIPDTLEDGVLYITLEYCTAVHKCVCGCGNEVITPFSPTDWHLIFDGKTVSLRPSIGNWNFNCKSHYWITNNKIEFALERSPKQIKIGKKVDIEKKKKYYQKKKK